MNRKRRWGAILSNGRVENDLAPRGFGMPIAAENPSVCQVSSPHCLFLTFSSRAESMDCARARGSVPKGVFLGVGVVWVYADRAGVIRIGREPPSVRKEALERCRDGESRDFRP